MIPAGVSFPLSSILVTGLTQYAWRSFEHMTHALPRAGGVFIVRYCVGTSVAYDGIGEADSNFAEDTERSSPPARAAEKGIPVSNTDKTTANIERARLFPTKNDTSPRFLT